MAKEIVWVRISLDDDVPEHMMGIFRCGSVVSEDEDGNEESHDDLIDNSEYRSKDEMIADVAKRLGVDPSIVEIID
jgi:hypothetical protein